MAVSAEGHVHVFTSDHVLAVLAGGTESEARVLFAQLADGRQFLNFFALWNQEQDVGEGATEESSLKGGDNDNFSIVSSLF